MNAKGGNGSSYRIQEFADLSGVTVRALHHYDRLGLLKPSRRMRTGYRVYRNADFARLEQIVVLKFLGMSLKDIGRLLKQTSPLKDTLRQQRYVLTEKRRRLDATIRAIEQAEQSFDLGQEPEWELFKRIVTEVEVQDNVDWTKKYYSEDARAKLEERKGAWSPELQARVSQQWTELIADIEGALGRDEAPSGAVAQGLAARWKSLLEGFTGGNPEIQRGLNKMWADHDSWPEGPAKSFRIPPEVQAFIMEALQGGHDV